MSARRAVLALLGALSGARAGTLGQPKDIAFSAATLECVIPAASPR